MAVSFKAPAGSVTKYKENVETDLSQATLPSLLSTGLTKTKDVQIKQLLSEISFYRNRCEKDDYLVRVVKSIVNKSGINPQGASCLSARKTNALPNSTLMKVNQILMSHRFSRYSRDLGSLYDPVDSEQDDPLTLFRLSTEYVSSGHVNLIPAEKSLLRNKVEREITTNAAAGRRQSIRGCRLVASAPLVPESFLELSCPRAVTLDQTFLHCMANVEENKKLVEELVDLRRVGMREIISEITTMLEAQVKISNVNGRLFHLNIKKSLYTESSNIVRAIKLIHTHLKTQADRSRNEISRKKGLLEAYQNLRGTKFDIILRDYCALLDEMKRHAWALQKLNQYSCQMVSTGSP
uniref:Uncharacterized protein n=1 Tax=Timema cristinae TaxID=61476 RepID=A0A7R9H2G1_TIMCR|nr:unnamed protein product [Timema cristinae]